MNNTYRLEHVAWEITTACNLRCGHCGSSCTDKKADELNTDEALALIDDIMQLHPREFIFTGGEPFMRKDWYELAKRISCYDTDFKIITNGTLITSEVIRQLADTKVKVVGISLDGTCEQHNRIRNANCYILCLKALKMLKDAGIPTAVNTTLVKENIGSFQMLKQDLHQAGVVSWQLQPGIASGRMSEHRDWMLAPKDIRRIIDFAYEENLKDEYPKIFLPDTIGYYSNKEALARRIVYGCGGYPLWKGCSAGIRSMDILYNGDVTGCLSIRDKSFTEGNVRERRASEIWNDENSFAWRRQLTPQKLSGHCRFCKYVEYCLGGCSNMRLCTKGSIYSSNDYCIYHLEKQQKE